MEYYTRRSKRFRREL
jgi:hypothetical protein